ncbi:hypothetical protein ES708_00245 [subsurface metagenome]
MITTEERTLLVEALVDARDASERDSSIEVVKLLGKYHGGYTDFPTDAKLPLDEAVDEAIDAVVSIEFDQDVTEVDLTGVAIAPDPGGVSGALLANKITIEHTNFANSTEYTVTIPTKAVKNGYGVGNKQIQWSFTTVGV